MKFFVLAFYILINCMYDVSIRAEVQIDLENSRLLDKLLLEYLRQRQFGSCDVLNFDNVIQSYYSCHIDPFHVDVEEETKNTFEEQPQKSDIKVWLSTFGSILQKTTTDVSDSLQQIGNGLYDAIGNNECGNDLNGNDLKVEARQWGCYIREGAVNVQEAAAPLAAEVATIFKDVSNGLTNSLLRDECDKRPSSKDNKLTVEETKPWGHKLFQWGCYIRQGAVNVQEAAVPLAAEVGNSLKDKIQQSRIYTYFYGEKKPPAWYEKFTKPFQNLWN